MTILDDIDVTLRPRPGRAAADKAVLADLVATTPSRTIGKARRTLRPRRVSVRVTAATCLVGCCLAAGGAAAATGVFSQRPTVFDEARCYSMASENFGTSFPGTSIGIVQPASVPQSTDSTDVPDQALSACAAVWSEGILLPDSSGAVPTPGSGGEPVPDLVVCVLPSGEAGVFPGGPDTCSSLGLPQMQPASTQP